MKYRIIIPLCIVITTMVGYSSPTNSSPQVFFKSYTQAINNNNWGDVFSCLTKESQDYMIYKLFFAAQMSQGSKLHAISEKYVNKQLMKSEQSSNKQMTPEERIKVVASWITDKRKFFIEGMQENIKRGKKQKYGKFKITKKGSTYVVVCSVTSIITHYEQEANNGKSKRVDEKIVDDVEFLLSMTNGSWRLTIPDLVRHKKHKKRKTAIHPTHNRAINDLCVLGPSDRGFVKYSGDFGGYEVIALSLDIGSAVPSEDLRIYLKKGNEYHKVISLPLLSGKGYICLRDKDRLKIFTITRFEQKQPQKGEKPVLVVDLKELIKKADGITKIK